MKAARDAIVLIKEDDCSVLDEGWSDQEPERCRARKSAI